VEADVSAIEKDVLQLGKYTFDSRLLIGTGKYKDFATMQAAHLASGAQVVTVAVRRLDLKAKGEDSLLHWIDTNRITLLPNTAGCYTAEDAVRTCLLARELGMSELVKVEVIGDPKTLFPDTAELIVACKQLVKEGFTVLPYTNDDPIVARKLQDVGCAARPSAAGSGCAIRSICRSSSSRPKCLSSSMLALERPRMRQSPWSWARTVCC
jgi:thiazole synthase